MYFHIHTFIYTNIHKYYLCSEYKIKMTISFNHKLETLYSYSFPLKSQAQILHMNREKIINNELSLLIQHYKIFVCERYILVLLRMILENYCLGKYHQCQDNY